MGYDLFISRKVFVDDKNIDLSAYTKTKGKTLIISENFIELRGWDVSEIVNHYISNDTQELEADEIIELYSKVCESRGQEPDKSLIEILQTDYDQHCHLEDGGVFYELHQSY
jgi:hypothetical protein